MDLILFPLAEYQAQGPTVAKCTGHRFGLNAADSCSPNISHHLDDNLFIPPQFLGMCLSIENTEASL